MINNYMKILPKSRDKDIVIQEMNDETLIYDVKRSHAICLNATSSLVWEFCDGKKDISEITECVNRKIKGNISEELVLFAIFQLEKEELILNAEKIEKPFVGLTRREIIKRVGGATVALSIVSSILVPEAINAQSVSCVSTSGTCIMALEDKCAGCGTQTIDATIFSSTDGSCTGTNFGMTSIMCSGVPNTSSTDFLIN